MAFEKGYIPWNKGKKGYTGFNLFRFSGTEINNDIKGCIDKVEVN